jgi:hypothetical protein
MQGINSGLYFSGSGVQTGSEVRPSAKWKRLFSPVRWWYSRSVLRLLLMEFCNWPRRIAVLLRTHRQVLPDRVQQCLSEHKLLLVCNDDMLRLQKQYSWLGLLDIRAAYQAWTMGVEAGYRIRRNEENSKEPIPS